MPSIHELPIELLIHIFAADIRLSHVCSLWRDTLQRTPEFWVNFLMLPDLITHTHQERSVGFWYSFIDRTMSQPLRLRLGGWCFVLLTRIPKHLSRLAFLHVQWRTVDAKEIQRRLLAMGPLPALEHLQLVCDLPGPQTNFLDLDTAGNTGSALLVDKYPRLRHLEVSPDFFIPAMVVPSLRTLAINSGEMTLATFILALVQCPALESLHLDHAAWSTWNTLEASQQVDLLHLHELRLSYSRDYDVVYAGLLLRYIRCPLSVRLDISLSSSTLLGLFHDTQSLNLVRALTRLIMRVTDPVDQLEGPRTYTLTVEGYGSHDVPDMPRVQIVNRGAHWGHLDDMTISPIFSIVYDFRSSAVKELQICLLDEQLNVTRTDWTALFEAFPSLTSLVVRISSCNGLLKALRRTPLLPAGLERLALTCANGSGVHHNLVLTLELRASLGSRLQRLEFGSSKSAFLSWHLARLRDVIAEVVVVSSDPGAYVD
ncbi:hypothetical protein C8T65DRAFT_655804 [Cerioporus squamosus]|nr:hypothetical protein C8T65DRAFT_655804 [Cerioporus squamosus]